MIMNLEINDVVMLHSFNLHKFICPLSVFPGRLQLQSLLWKPLKSGHMAKKKMFPVWFALFLKVSSSRINSLHIVLWIFLFRIWHEAFCHYTLLLFNLLESVAAGVSSTVCCMIALSFWIFWVLNGRQFFV